MRLCWSLKHIQYVLCKHFASDIFGHFLNGHAMLNQVKKSYEVSDNASLCSTTRRSHKAKCSLEGHTQCHTSCASQQSGAGPQPRVDVDHSNHAFHDTACSVETPSTELCTSWRRASSCLFSQLTDIATDMQAGMQAMLDTSSTKLNFRSL